MIILRKDALVEPQVRIKLSRLAKGRKKTIQHAANISKGMENYWSQIPQQSSTATGFTSTGRIV